MTTELPSCIYLAIMFSTCTNVTIPKWTSGLESLNSIEMEACCRSGGCEFESHQGCRFLKISVKLEMFPLQMLF
jgi:hypothetical protein